MTQTGYICIMILKRNREKRGANGYILHKDQRGAREGFKKEMRERF